jgi:hypothetical protein
MGISRSNGIFLGALFVATLSFTHRVGSQMDSIHERPGGPQSAFSLLLVKHLDIFRDDFFFDSYPILMSHKHGHV